MLHWRFNVGAGRGEDGFVFEFGRIERRFIGGFGDEDRVFVLAFGQPKNVINRRRLERRLVAWLWDHVFGGQVERCESRARALAGAGFGSLSGKGEQNATLPSPKLPPHALWRVILANSSVRNVNAEFAKLDFPRGKAYVTSYRSSSRYALIVVAFEIVA